MEGRESRRANDIFFVCSLVDYIARKTKNRRSDVVEALGPQRLGRIVELADVYHSDNIDAVSDRFIEEAGHRRRRFRQRRRRPLRRSLPLGYRQGVQAARPRHRRPRGNDRCWGDPARPTVRRSALSSTITTAVFTTIRPRPSTMPTPRESWSSGFAAFTWDAIFR